MKTTQYVRQERAIADLSWYVQQEAKIQARTAAAAAGRRSLQKLTDAGHIYVIEFASGAIKVGKTTSPSRRLGQHTEAAAIYGVELADSWVSHKHYNHSKTERELIKFCNGHGRLVSGREYFRDVPFVLTRDYAAALVEYELTTAELERRQERDRERRAYLERLIEAADDDMSMTWQEAHERLPGEPPIDP